MCGGQGRRAILPASCSSSFSIGCQSESSGGILADHARRACPPYGCAIGGGMRRRRGHSMRRVCFYRDCDGFGVPFPLNFAASWCPQHHLQLNGKQGARAPSDAPTCAAPATVSERRVCPPSRKEDGYRAVCPDATVPSGMGRRTGRFASPDTGQDGGSPSRCATLEGIASRSCCQRPAGERVRLTLLVFST